jgi:hypothetical protein
LLGGEVPDNFYFRCMLIEEKPLEKWINYFYGYGSWQARFWLVSHEDGGGDLPEEVAEKVNYFYERHSEKTKATLCDIRDSYKHFSLQSVGAKGKLFSSLHNYRFGANAQLSNVWRNLTAFVHGCEGNALPDFLDYQKEIFASVQHRHEALIKLYPLPSPHNHAWYYSWLHLPQFPFLKSRQLYQEHVYELRMKNILESMAEHKPEVVLMYGMENINTLKKSIQDYFDNVKFKTVKATRQQIPQHHRADINGTRLVITTQIPALRHNRVETGFDWYEFGASLR